MKLIFIALYCQIANVGVVCMRICLRLYVCGTSLLHINNENQVIYFLNKRLVNVLSDVLFY